MINIFVTEFSEFGGKHLGKTQLEDTRRGRYSVQVLLDKVYICMRNAANCNYINLGTQSVLQEGATSYNPEKYQSELHGKVLCITTHFWKYEYN